jgi:hypothetical protein
MRHLRYLVLLAGLVIPTAYSQAQVSIGVRIGPTYGLYNAPPVCEYGFYPDYPFACAPYGYWGPEWFVDGVFIGAGPWNRFYYTHAGFYRPFYVNRGFGGFGFRGRVETFRGGRGFERDRGFREGGREFHDNGRRGFNDGGRFRDRGGNGFRGGDRGGNRGGGREFHGGSGGGNHGSGHGEHGGSGGHGGRR